MGLTPLEDLNTLAPEFTKLTDDILFGDIWKRSDLSPRDRSLITIAVLAAQNRIEQIDFHLQRGLDNGLSKKEIVGVLTHVAFYAGWPSAVTGLRHFNKILGERKK